MKKLFFILILIVSGLSASTQTYLKVADKPQYELYKKWCYVPVQRHIEINVKIKLQSVNGYYTNPEGLSYAVYPVTGTLVKISSVPIVEASEKLISFYTSVTVPRRTPTVSDFYANWGKIKLEYGLAGNP